VTEPQDPRARALIDELLSASPPRPPLPDPHAVRSVRRARRAVVVAVLFACAMALIAGGVWLSRVGTRRRPIVIEQPTTTTSSPPGRTTSTTVAPSSRILPAGTAFIGLDHDTGVVYALDVNGRALRTLFTVGVEATHHWPTITQMQLGPDQTTLWYAANPTATAPCSTITEHNLATGATRGRFQGSWIALSPDGTRLAYAGCIAQDPTVYLTDLRNGDTWTARAPVTGPTVTPLGYLTWTPDSRHVLAEYQNGTQWNLSDLTPTSTPGTIAWGPAVLTLSGEDHLTTAPDALYVSAGTVTNTWSIDSYDWTTYHRTGHIPTTLTPLEIVVVNGRVYFMGGLPTGGSSIDTSLYRLETNQAPTLLRHGIGDIVATSTRPNPASSKAAAALAAYLAAHPEIMIHTNPFASGLDQLAIVGVTRSPHDHVITVLSLTTGTATPVSNLTLPAPSYDFARDTPPQLADVTGDNKPDVLVRVMAADNNPGVIVSADGGTWRILPLSNNPSDVYIGRDPTIVNGQLHSTRNDCIPDCAQGHTTTVTWRYDRQHQHLVSQ